MIINVIHQIMEENLAQQRMFFCSKAQFQNFFSSQLQTTAPAYQVCLDFQPTQNVSTTMDIWGQAQSGNIAVELRYPTAEQQFIYKNIQEPVSLTDDPIETAVSEIREAIEKLEWAVTAKFANKGFAILLTNQPKLWEQSEITTAGHITPSRTYDIDWKDYSSLTTGKNPHFRYFAIEVKYYDIFV